MFCLTAFAENEVSSIENVQFNQCGINSLYLCFKYHKIDEKLDDIYASIKADADDNVSLKQLANFAKKEGLYVHPVINPSMNDINKFLTKDNSIIIQFKYNLNLQDKPQLSHIAAIIKPQQKIFLLDYPQSAKELDLARLAMILSKSDGMLVLSKEPIKANLAEILNGRSLKSWSFYLICASFIMFGLFCINVRKAKKQKEV